MASNFERYLYYRVGEDPAAVGRLMQEFGRTGAIRVPGCDAAFAAGTGTVSEARETIRRYYQDYGYVLDPHTAVGAAVAERFLRPDEPVLSLATAHPAKFAETIVEALGQNPARHPRLEALAGLPTRCVVLPAERDAVAGYIRETLASAS